MKLSIHLFVVFLIPFLFTSTVKSQDKRKNIIVKPISEIVFDNGVPVKFKRQKFEHNKKEPSDLEPDRNYRIPPHQLRLKNVKFNKLSFKAYTRWDPIHKDSIHIDGSISADGDSISFLMEYFVDSNFDGSVIFDHGNPQITDYLFEINYTNLVLKQKTDSKYIFMYEKDKSKYEIVKHSVEFIQFNKHKEVYKIISEIIEESLPTTKITFHFK